MLVSSKRLDSVLIWFSVGHYLFGLDVVVSTLFCNQFCFCLLMLLWRAAYITARANLSEHKSDQVGHSTFKTFQLSSPCAWEFRKKKTTSVSEYLFSLSSSPSPALSHISLPLVMSWLFCCSHPSYLKEALPVSNYRTMYFSFVAFVTAAV